MSNCTNPVWNAECGQPGCAVAGSNSGCDSSGGGCANCYRGDMVLPAGFAPETEEHKHVEPARFSVVLPNLRVSGDPAVMGPMFVAAGLQIGDEIITIEGRPILDVKEAVEKLFNFEGECCELYVYRPGTDDSFTATLMRDSKE